MTDHDEKTVSLERGVERPRGTDVADDREALLVRGPAHARAPRPLAGTLHGDRGHPALGSVPRGVLREEAVARLRPRGHLGKAGAPRDDQHHGDRRGASGSPCALRSPKKAGTLRSVTREAVRDLYPDLSVPIIMLGDLVGLAEVRDPVDGDLAEFRDAYNKIATGASELAAILRDDIR